MATGPMRLLARLLPLLLVLLLPLPAPAQSGGGLPQPLAQALNEDDPVVAVVNGVEIRWNDVVLSALELPTEYQSQVEALFPVLLGRMIDLELIAQRARQEGLDKSDEFKRRMHLAENKLLQEGYLAGYLGDAVTEKDVQQRVEVMTSGSSREEVRLAMVVCASREICLAALNRLRAGADFAQVARENSVHVSAASGGDLGWFGRAELQPEPVAAEAFSLPVGQYSRQPLETEIGWVLVKVLERRMAEPLSKQELADRIRRELGRLAIDKLLVELRQKAEIRLFPD
jgi:peptidyl-prolyl cis-trans isomerase C